MSTAKLYGPFHQIITMEGLNTHGPIHDDELTIHEQVGIFTDFGMIVEIGDYTELSEKFQRAIRIKPSESSWVAVPSFVDCHTHICWSGTRVDDYSSRVAGKSYLEIAAAGGGIMDTVKATRKASEEELVQGILSRIEEHLRRGISVIEVKSGYGLTIEDELKMLRAIRSAKEETKAVLIPTFLGAHIKPKDFEGSNSDYLKKLLNDVVPIIQKEELATRADIFVEEGAFTIDEARWYSQELIELGFDITMHVDQFHSGGSLLANELGCVSADHLEYTDDHGIRAFSNSETVAVALPGASLGLGMQFSPARKLLDAGASLAIASDWNPGSAPMGDLVTQASILGASEKLTIAETLAGITTRASKALNSDYGCISTGKEAVFNIYETDDFRNIFYQQGQLRPLSTVLGNINLYHE
ncbi:MAG: imidazolonepropionase [Balneolaceae bacterium]